MDLKGIELPAEMSEMLDAIYKKAKKHNRELTESLFFQRIIERWLEPYKRSGDRPPLHKRKVVLRNRIKKAAREKGKTMLQIAGEIGINRTYLGQVAGGESEPSVTVALLLADALHEMVADLFYLETVD